MSAPTDHQFIDNPQATAWNYGAATDEEHCFLRHKTEPTVLVLVAVWQIIVDWNRRNYHIDNLLEEFCVVRQEITVC